ncbi:MAG: sugar ABC transporter substrate-binding protein [Geminocystis sp.]|nr:sugar ABC transporter substrate-binding protein [Geminocystis sp.]HIK36947.1 sugar ABC transporter substrate-binding protein [Geminocystis sp. M7585_C2015_104]MCS7147425.1 sugar ABC transporter substrate-binding protein [Geminocystis sp.]MCX8079338.1 sugar ABC transporter substrate-binding protein [Geminocystis sp.]MDW8117158.1 sugar ABC transporter substrate-binding protein [Geminocystis sp.]
MSRRGLSLLSVFCFLLGFCVSLLVGCQGGNPGNAEIEFWTMQLQPQFNDYFRELNQEFEQKNAPYKVKWVDVPWNAMESKILTAVSSKNAPDVANLNPDFAASLASRKAWLDLDKEVSPQYKQQYLEKIWEANSIKICSPDCEKIVFGIPWYLTTTITVYNKELLKKAGISQPPQTFAQLATVAAKVKEKTGKYAFFVPFVPNDSNEVLQSFIQMGVKLVDEEGKAAFNTPEGLAVFRYWVDLYNRGLLPPEVLTQGHRHAVELYQAGELALLGTGAEFLKIIANNAPSIYQQSDVAPQITGDTGKRNVAVMNLVIPKDSKNPSAALQYALFVTNGDNQLRFSQLANVLPSHRQALSQYIKNLEAEMTKSDNADNLLLKARKISAQQLETAEVLIPPIKNLAQLKRIIYENLQQAMLNQKTVQQAINDAANQWNSIREGT